MQTSNLALRSGLPRACASFPPWQGLHFAFTHSYPGFRMAYFQRHVFFCVNERQPPDACCAAHDSVRMQVHAKDRIKKLGLNGAGKVRINKAGCLDRCDEGPCLVVYPEGVWYTYVDERDIDEIVDQHLAGGRIVERLRLP
jgi:(2Fe-2S) ferredoxin